MPLPTRIAATVVVLLSQLSAGATVLCDEGLGRRVLEFVLQSCCEVGVQAPACPEDGCDELTRDDCGPCTDASVAPVLQRVEERPDGADGNPPPAAGRLGGLPAPQAAARTAPTAPAARAAPGTVALVARTIVLTC
jgi:hypothetical protein